MSANTFLLLERTAQDDERDDDLLADDRPSVALTETAVITTPGRVVVWVWRPRRNWHTRSKELN